MPRYLAQVAPDPAEPLPIQRQEEASLSGVPRLQLTAPSLLRPRDPYARFYPDFGNRLRLDPELELRMLILGRTLLSPANVLAVIAPVAPLAMLPSSPANPAGGTAPAGPITPVTPQPVAPPLPTAPATTPQASPSPKAAPEGGARPAGGGDVLSAVLALPQVSSLLQDIQNQFTSDFSRYWSSASLGQQIGFVSGSVVVGSSILAPILGFRESRDFVLPLLNDVVIPVPGLSGYGLEFHFGERDVMIGAHLDVGRLLPSLWGFGEASFRPIGGPPGSDPNALPPLSRKAEGVAPEIDPRSIADAIRARAGRGSTLEGELRNEVEPPLGADLSGVRIHTDADADVLARSVRANAFTSGRDIFFRAGRYDPESPATRRLLAHELVHVAQQAGGTPARRDRDGGLIISEPQDADEREAERLSDRLAEGTRGPAARVLATSAATPQGQPEPAAVTARNALPDGSSNPPARAEQAEREGSPER